MKGLITIALLFFFINSQAQDKSMLIGKWKYKDASNKEELDSVQLGMLEMFFSEMFFYFDENGKFKGGFLGVVEEGVWELRKDELELIPNTGKSLTYKIEKITKEELFLDMNTGSIIMERTDEVAGDKVFGGNELEGIEVTVDEVAKNWQFIRQESEGRVEKLEDAINDLLKDSYLYLYKNGKYKLSLVGIVEKGKWEIGAENTSIVRMRKKSKSIWYVEAISDCELILRKGNEKKRWVYKCIQ